MGFGGPVWHVSVADRGIGAAQLEDVARRWLAGVGDAALGEWSEERLPFFHLRRRLSASEQEQAGDVLDIRGTWEAEKRLNRVRRYLPAGWSESATP